MAKKRGFRMNLGKVQLAFILGIVGIVLIVLLSGIGSVLGGVGNSDLVQSVSGSGSISEIMTTTVGDRVVEVEMARITFSGNLGIDRNGQVRGNWRVRFPKVGNPVFDDGDFHSDVITNLDFFTQDGCGLYPAGTKSATFRADGRFNGQYGWVLWGSVLDAGSQSDAPDSIELTLEYRGQADVYHSSSSKGGDFTDDSGSTDCPESLRKVVKGHITIR